MSIIFFVLGTLMLPLNLIRIWGLAVSDWLYFLALITLAIETITIDRRNFVCWWKNHFLWMIAPIIFGAIISTMNARNWVIALSELFQQVFVVTVFVSMTWVFIRRNKLSPIVAALIFAGLFATTVVLLDYFTGSRYGPILSGTPDIQIWGRYAGPLKHPNKLGYFLVLTSLLSIGKLLDADNGKSKFFMSIFWVGSLMAQLFGIYLSGSMTAYLGLFTGVIILLLSSRKFLVYSLRFTGLILLVGVIIVVWGSLSKLFTNDISGFQNTLIATAYNRVKLSTAESRIVVYDQAWSRIKQNPVWGVGYDQLSTSGIDSVSRLLTGSIHNSLLQIWYAGGFFAFIGWLAIYAFITYMSVKVVLRSIKGEPLSALLCVLVSASVAIILMDQFQDSIYPREKWLLLGLFVSVIWSKEDYSKKNFLHLI